MKRSIKIWLILLSVLVVLGLCLSIGGLALGGRMADAGRLTGFGPWRWERALIAAHIRDRDYEDEWEDYRRQQREYWRDQRDEWRDEAREELDRWSGDWRLYQDFYQDRDEHRGIGCQAQPGQRI